MDLYARQGDLVFDKLKELPPGELTKERGLVLAGATSGGTHTALGEVLARRQGLVTFLRVEKPTTVEHAGRHKAVTLEPGDYEVRPLRERGSGEDRAVED
jgi:hypothetical protein